MNTQRCHNEEEVRRGITVRLINDDEVERFNNLLDNYHYLKSINYRGRFLRYVAEYKGEWFALISFSAAALKIKDREKWIGWTPRQRAIRLGFVVNNSRFLMLPERGAFPNLASRVLALCLRRLCADWEKKWEHPVLIVETFVANNREGTCYRACGFEDVGMTAGYSRVSEGYYSQNNEPKRIYLRTIRRGGRKILRRAKLPEELKKYEGSIAGPCSLVTNELKSLLDHFRALKDSRRGHGLRHRQSYILSCAAVAVLMGASGYKAIEDMCIKFTQSQLKSLGARKGKDGLYSAPSDSTIFRVLNKVDVPTFEKIISSWLSSLEISSVMRIAIDGKTLRGSSRADKKALQFLSAVTHQLHITLRQIAINAKSNEIPALSGLVKSTSPLPGTIYTADALHCQKKSAKLVTEDYNSDYVFGLKGNQSSVAEYARLLLPQEAFPPRSDE